MSPLITRAEKSLTAAASRLYNRAEKQLLTRRRCTPESTLFYADMAELADAAVLGAAGRPCRFESCYPHVLTLVDPRVFFYSNAIFSGMLYLFSCRSPYLHCRIATDQRRKRIFQAVLEIFNTYSSFHFHKIVLE